jgi:hypothetical protein
MELLSGSEASQSFEDVKGKKILVVERISVDLPLWQEQGAPDQPQSNLVYSKLNICQIDLIFTFSLQSSIICNLGDIRSDILVT